MKIVRMIGSLGIIIAIGYLLFISVDNVTSETKLSKRNIENRVASLYGGEVNSIVKQNERYAVTFKKESATYEVLVNEKNGRFSELSLIYKDVQETASKNNEDSTKEPTTQNQASTTNSSKETNTSSPTANTPKENNEPSKATTKPTPTPTTEKPAANSNNAAAQQTTPPAPKPVPTRITEQRAKQIAMKQFNGKVDDIEFYSTTDGGYYIVEIERNEEEAAIQVHAITGKILSVAFDD